MKKIITGKMDKIKMKKDIKAFFGKFFNKSIKVKKRQEVMHNLFPYQEKSIETLMKFTEIRGKSILEIGSSPQMTVAERFVSLGAKKVICTNIIDSYEYKEISPKISFKRIDARQMDIKNNSINIVFGAAVLEHLYDLNLVLEEIERILKPGGIACLHGGPLWSSALGHHLWVHSDGEKYEFNDNNPIDNWSHLILSNDQMNEQLKKKGIINLDSARITEMIYNGSLINRYLFKDFIKFFNESKLSIVQLNAIKWNVANKKILDKLNFKNRDILNGNNFGAIEVVLYK